MPSQSSLHWMQIVPVPARAGQKAASPAQPEGWAGDPVRPPMRPGRM